VATLTITGRLQVDGHPLPGADVLVFSEAARRLAGAGQTGADGGFTVSAEGEEPLVLLAKVRGPVCSLEALPVGGSGPVQIDVDTSEGFAELNGSAEEFADPALVVRLDPARVDGVPDWLIAFAKQKREGVFEGSYCEIPLADGAFQIRLRRGDYRVRGDLLVDGPVGKDGTTPATLVVKRVQLADGREAPGDPSGGFLVSVEGDTSVRLTVGPEG
jgi:hypothetical protein